MCLFTWSQVGISTCLFLRGQLIVLGIPLNSTPGLWLCFWNIGGPCYTEVLLCVKSICFKPWLVVDRLVVWMGPILGDLYLQIGSCRTRAILIGPHPSPTSTTDHAVPCHPGLTKSADFAEILWNSAELVRAELKIWTVYYSQFQNFEKSDKIL
jgi:hypothetical protein